MSLFSFILAKFQEYILDIGLHVFMYFQKVSTDYKNMFICWKTVFACLIFLIK